MSKTLKVLTSTAVAAAALVPVAAVVVEAQEVEVQEGLYFYSADGTSKFIDLIDFALMTDDEFNALLDEYGMDNIYAVVEGESVNLGDYAFEGAEYAPVTEDSIPAGTYEGVAGDVVIGGDETPEENLNETFFYNLVA